VTTRSAVLCVATVPTNGFVWAYTCPPGTVVLVKSVYTRLAEGTTASTAVFAGRGATGSAVIWRGGATLTRATVSPGEVWCVLEPGDQLGCQVAGDSSIFWISGAVLPT